MTTLFILCLTAVAVLWFVASCVWFVRGLRRKGRPPAPSRWWDYVLWPPVMLLATLIGAINKRRRS